MNRFALGISYDGTAFHGWQRQRDRLTIQEVLETAASQVADEPIVLQVAGRTDRGVHATGQTAAFSTTAQRHPDQWCRGINTLTPPSVMVNWVQAVDEGFHPRFDAVARRYVYIIEDRAPHLPFSRDQVWATLPLDAELMHRAARPLVGEHDFSAFRAAACQAASPWRRVNRCAVRRVGARVVVDIEANAFLHHMVRNIVRGLHDASALGDERHLHALLESKDRDRLGPTAPPQGLYLVAVSYPQIAFPTAPEPPLVSA